MRIVIDTDNWPFVKWLRRLFNRPPKDWWTYHLKTCGTQYRGCDPNCPKNIYEETGKWVG
jgi:hypothetical protein